MRKFMGVMSVVSILLPCGALWSASISPLDLTFEKEYQVRNFFNSSITLDRLDLSNPLSSEPLHLTTPGLSIESKEQALTFSNPHSTVQESYHKLGALYPYSAVDVDVVAQEKVDQEASLVIGLYRDSEDWIAIAQRHSGLLTMEVFKKGKSVSQVTLTDAPIQAPYTLRVHLCGAHLSFFRVREGKWQYLKTCEIGAQFDLRREKGFSVIVGARLGKGERLTINRAEQYLTCGTGQADPKVLHYEDGELMVEGDTIWLAMTTRGYDPIPASHQGIYAYNVATRKWSLCGDMTFDRGDGVMRQWHASDVFYDRQEKQWKVFTVSHGDDHKIYSGICTKDPREGISKVDVTLCKYDSGGNEEDPSVLYDAWAEKWRMAMCKRGKGGYQTVLLESSGWNGEWREVARCNLAPSTGILIQKVGEKRYVFTGRGKSNYEVLSYPAMEKLGSLKVNNISSDYNLWPVIIPLTQDQKTTYYMLTFDRSRTTGKYSYGELYWYKGHLGK